jgi:hypothetical protein
MFFIPFYLLISNKKYRTIQWNATSLTYAPSSSIYIFTFHLGLNIKMRMKTFYFLGMDYRILIYYILDIIIPKLVSLYTQYQSQAKPISVAFIRFYLIKPKISLILLLNYHLHVIQSKFFFLVNMFRPSSVPSRSGSHHSSALKKIGLHDK